MTLLRHCIERSRRGATPSRAITAPLPRDVPTDPDKGLLPQRDAYFAQSAATRDGQLAPFPLAQSRLCSREEAPA